LRFQPTDIDGAFCDLNNAARHRYLNTSYASDDFFTITEANVAVAVGEFVAWVGLSGTERKATLLKIPQSYDSEELRVGLDPIHSIPRSTLSPFLRRTPLQAL
jgi:ABC-type lipoprotein export system ATPase subunit